MMLFGLRSSTLALLGSSALLSACAGDTESMPAGPEAGRGNDISAFAAGLETSQFSSRFVELEDGRTLEIEVGMPQSASGDGARLSGIILFASGANLSPETYRILTSAWANAGYAVYSPLFIDSERHPQRETKNTARILQTRLSDYDTVTKLAIGELRVDLPLIAAGHSYGAYIAQILGGATVINPQTKETIGLSRPAMLKGVVALSPPPVFAEFNPSSSWETMATPMLAQTGTTDISPPFTNNWQQHLDSHCNAPTGTSWSAVYRDINHYFGGLIGRPVDAPADTSKARMDRFTRLSLAFMDGAIGEQSGLSDFGSLTRKLSDNTQIEAAFKCPRGEQ